MSEIQDLLNASTQDMVDDYLIIDDNSREIYVPSGELLFGVTNDEKTERKYFQCPRIVGDNVDLTQYQLYINYQNANGEKDKYIVTDVKVVDDNITFTWLLSRKVTEYQGNISFIVCARNVDSLGNITNEWNTAIATGTCVVGLEVDDLTPGEQEQARDYFLQLEQELSALAETENNRLLTTSSNQITNITNKGSEQVQLVENTAKKALDSIPSTYTDLQKQVNEVEDRELKDANGITQELTITDGYAQLTDTATKRLNSLVIKGNTVQNSTEGYQLFYLPDDTKISNGVTTTIKDGLISCRGTPTGENWFNVCEKLNISLKQGIEYTFSINKALSVRCALKTFDDAGEEDRNITIGKTSMQFTPNSDISSAYVWIAAPAGTNIDIQFRVQVEKGSTAHNYESYTGGKPSPNPEYPQEIKAVNELSGVMSGKNLLKPHGSYPRTGYGITFNLMNDGIHVNGKCTASNWYTFIYSDTLQAGTYYINGIKGASNSRYQVVLYKNDVIIGYITTNNFKLVLKEKAKIELSLYVYSGYGTFNDLVLPYMICRNENDLYLYAPYQGQSLLNYTLQNPLYKLGDVYDYIDLNRGKIVRNIGVVTFDGSSDEDIILGPPSGSRRVYLYLFHNSILSIEHINPYCKSNMFKFTNLWVDGVMSHNHLFYVSDTNIYVSYNEITSLNDFKTWLNKNPITVVYQLATPTEEDIPTELLTQLKQLQTYSGKTNISFEASDVYPTIDLEYIKDTKKYIESKEELDNQSIIDIDYRVTCLELDMEEQ